MIASATHDPDLFSAAVRSEVKDMSNLKTVESEATP